MATSPVRFEFACMKETLVFKHQIPSELLTQAAKVDPDLRNAFTTAIYHVFLEHVDACIRASDDCCPICHEPTVTVSWTPIIVLHPVETLVTLSIAGFCGKKICETRIDQLSLLAAQQGGAQALPASASRVQQPKSDLKCEICGKPDAKMCGRCKKTAYCGKEHRKKDYKTHKKICAKLANAVAAEVELEASEAGRAS